MKTTFYETISRNKRFLMGCAILWILVYHSAFTFTGKAIYRPFAYLFKTIGYGGVDIFMLLSGFGLYCSLHKNGDVRQFYIRRAWRLLPSYLPFILVWILAEACINGISWQSALGNLFCTGLWLGTAQQLNWYVQAIFLFYLATPLLFYLINGTRRSVWRMAVLLGLSILFGVPAWGGVYQLIAISRLPVYLLGMAFGMAYTESRRMPPAVEALAYALMPIGASIPYLVIRCFGEPVMWQYGLWWYPFLLSTPGLCLLLSRMADALRRFLAPVVRAVEKAGNCSFEIYLFQIALYDYTQRMFDLNTLTTTLLLAATVVLGMLYHHAAERAVRWLKG